MRTIESAPLRLAAMSSQFPEPPSEAVFAAIVAQAELDVADAKPKAPEPTTAKVPGGFRLEGVTPEWQAFHKLLSKRVHELQWKEGGPFDTWRKAAYAHAKANKDSIIGPLTVAEYNIIADVEEDEFPAQAGQ
jgi:hypothetical protein